MSSGQTEWKAVVVDDDRSAIALVRSLLNTRKFSVFTAKDKELGWFLLKNVEPQLVFFAHSLPDLDGPLMAREFRRSELNCRKAPVIMLAHQVTDGDIRRARDSGVDEVLRKPFAVKDLVLRVDTAMHKRREWIEGIGYVGPDRRRFNSAEFAGRRQRRVDRETLSPEHARISQALKIMKAAIEAIDAEPRQAMRALLAQADELQDSAVALTDFELAAAAKTLRIQLNNAVENGRFSSQHMASELNQLFTPGKAKQTA